MNNCDHPRRCSKYDIMLFQCIPIGVIIARQFLFWFFFRPKLFLLTLICQTCENGV
jgi:hypothetical protein